MLQHRRRNPESWILDEDALVDPARADCFGGEGCLETKPYCLSCKRGTDFGHHESQITGFAIDEIPEIGLKLVVDAIDEAVGP